MTAGTTTGTTARTSTEDTHSAPLGSGRPELALRAVRAAGDAVNSAKRTRSVALIASALRDLQTAVDVARELDVEWGRIGRALGMARGNAYQRFRKKPPCRDFELHGGGTDDDRIPA